MGGLFIVNGKRPSLSRQLLPRYGQKVVFSSAFIVVAMMVSWPLLKHSPMAVECY